MKLLVVGAGGAGGYFAARWAQAGLDVSVLARGAHLEAIAKSGIRLRHGSSEDVVPVRAIGDASEAGDVELVVFATKTWQLPDAIASVAPHVPASASVLGLQNGVETVAQLSAGFSPAATVGATCRIISMVEAPGVIRHVGIPPTVLIGEPSGEPSPRITQLCATLHIGDALSVTAASNVDLEIWRKFLFFAPISAVGAAARVPIAQFRSVPESRALLAAALTEVFTLATARGVPLATESVAQTLGFIDTIPDDGTTSMQRDIIEGRPSELEALAGAVTRMGRASGVATPVHDALYAALLPQEQTARRAAQS